MGTAGGPPSYILTEIQDGLYDLTVWCNVFEPGQHFIVTRDENTPDDSIRTLTIQISEDTDRGIHIWIGSFSYPLKDIESIVVEPEESEALATSTIEGMFLSDKLGSISGVTVVMDANVGGWHRFLAVPLIPVPPESVLPPRERTLHAQVSRGLNGRCGDRGTSGASRKQCLPPPPGFMAGGVGRGVLLRPAAPGGYIAFGFTGDEGAARWPSRLMRRTIRA